MLRNFFYILRTRLRGLTHPRNRIYLPRLHRHIRYDIDEYMPEVLFTLVEDFVETAVALHAARKPLDRFRIRWTPRHWREQLSRTLGENYLAEQYGEPAPRELVGQHLHEILQIYRWIKDTYPTLYNPHGLAEPPYMFVTADGMPTHDLFGPNGMHDYHPTYAAYMDAVQIGETERYAIIQRYLTRIVHLRGEFWF